MGSTNLQMRPTADFMQHEQLRWLEINIPDKKETHHLELVNSQENHK